MGVDNKKLDIVSDKLEDIQEALMLASKMNFWGTNDRLKIKSITQNLIILKATNDISTLKYEHYDVPMLRTLYKKINFVYDPKLDKDLGWHDSQEEAYQLIFNDSIGEIHLRLTEIGFSK